MTFAEEQVMYWRGYRAGAESALSYLDENYSLDLREQPEDGESPHDDALEHIDRVINLGSGSHV